MDNSVKATIACVIASFVLMMTSGLLPFVANIPFAVAIKMPAAFIGFGTAFLLTTWLLAYQWHQPMYKEH